jgi:uncharacterized membrane protein
MAGTLAAAQRRSVPSDELKAARSPSAIKAKAPVRNDSPIRAALSQLMRPGVAFILLSGLLGSVTVFATPPLRGPDEAAHFLRAYGISRGEIIPSTVDEKGRKGIWLASRLYRGFELFESSRYKIGDANFSYRDVFREYRHGHDQSQAERPPVFVLYSGSEGYSPVPYIPYVMAALVARAVKLDFLGTLYLMRFAGLVVLTAVGAMAITMMPYLRWAFLCIAMLPAALYARAVISADGTALASVMIVAALCVRSTRRVDAPPLLEQAAWMAVCVLSKPPQIAFTLLAAMRRPFRELMADWRALAIIVLPGCIIAILWFYITGSDVAAWRMSEPKGVPMEQFEVTWKLWFMLEHPLHFPKAAFENFKYSFDLWQQLIGVLGWLDTPLQPWVYPTLSGMLAVCFLVPTDPSRSIRLRTGTIALVAIICYWLALNLVFFLVWTPIDSNAVSGLQGRYFIVILPLLALAVATAINWGLSVKYRATVAVVSAILSGGATIEAILRMDWKL